MKLKKITIVFLIFISLLSFARVEDRLDLNRASMRELTFLPGITQELAQAIVEYRKSKGGFQRIEELLLIVGEIIFENIKYDIFVTPPEVIAKGTLSGRMTFGMVEDNRYIDGRPFNLTMNFKQGDTFNGYLSQEGYTFNSDNQARMKDNVSKSFTYFIYDYVPAFDERKNVFEKSIFKVITVEEQKAKDDDLKNELSEKFGSRLSVKDDDRYVTGYFASNPSVVEYFKHPEIIVKAEDRKEKLPLKIEDRDDYSVQNLERFNELIEDSEENREKAKENNRNVIRKLLYKVDFGNVSSPYVRSPKYINTSGDGLSVDAYTDNADFTVFYYKSNYMDHDDPTYGAKIERSFSNTRVGTVLYTLDNEKTDNTFNHFMLYGDKSLDRQTSLYMEYGTIFNILDSFYIRTDTRYRKMNVSTVLNITSAHFDDLSELEPFGALRWSTLVAGDVINPYLKIEYFLPEGNRLIFETSHNESANIDSKGKYRESISSMASLTYRYRVNPKFRTETILKTDRKLKRGQGGSTDGVTYEYTTGSMFFEYKPDRDFTFTTRFRRDSDTERDGNYLNISNYSISKNLNKNTNFSFSTYSERPPGLSKFRENRFTLNQKLSSVMNFRLRNTRQFTNNNSGVRRYLGWTEFMFTLNF